MVSESETCVLPIEKNFNKTINKMDGLEEEMEEDVVLRRNNQNASATLLDNTSVELGSPINNVDQITSILTITQNGDDHNLLKSYKSNDLWRLDHTSQFLYQQAPFMQRNLSFRERSVDQPDVTEQPVQMIKPERPQSLQVTPSTSSSSSSSSISPFKRESIIRQSWNNLFRKKDKGRDKNNGGNGGDDIKVTKSDKNNDKINDTNNNNNNNAKDKDKQDTDSDIHDVVKTLERIPSGLFRKGHSRNSSSSSCASYR